MQQSLIPFGMKLKSTVRVTYVTMCKGATMDELPDFELRKTTDESSPETPAPTRPVGLWVVVAMLMVAIGVAAYFAFAWRPRPAPVASSAPPAPARAAPRSLGGSPEQSRSRRSMPATRS